MPEISRFFGIVIRMYAEAGGSHAVAHFHAYYQGHAAVYGLENLDRLAGELPRRQERLALAWAEIHRDELIEDWQLLQTGRSPRPIEPLQ